MINDGPAYFGSEVLYAFAPMWIVGWLAFVFLLKPITPLKTIGLFFFWYLAFIRMVWREHRQM